MKGTDRKTAQRCSNCGQLICGEYSKKEESFKCYKPEYEMH